MNFLNRIHNMIFLTDSILRNEIGWNKIRILFVFGKLNFKRFFSVFLGIRFKKESFLGYSVKIFNYTQFYLMFNEIFLLKAYTFKTHKNSPFIIDCGSNIGMSVIYFRHLYPHANIIAFEPEPNAFAALQQNIKTNKLNVKTEQVALSETERTLKLFTPSDEKGSWAATTFRNITEKPNRRFYKVRATKLSNYINHPVDMLKMDIEYAEVSVLRDLEKQKKLKYVKQIVLEYHYDPENMENRLSELSRILEENNFSFVIKNPPLTSNLQPDTTKAYNLLIYAINKKSDEVFLIDGNKT